MKKNYFFDKYFSAPAFKMFSFIFSKCITEGILNRLICSLFNCRGNNLTNYVIAWVFVIVFGPYFSLFNTPLRIDHLLWPLIVFGILIHKTKNKIKLSFPKELIPFCFFIGTTFVASFLSLFNPKFVFSPVALLSGIESYLRIFFTLFVMNYLLLMNSFDEKKFIKFFLIISLFLALMGIYQVFDFPYIFVKIVHYISSNFYVGRYTREQSCVDLCLGVRAMSTFYSPSNYSLYSMFVFILFIFMRRYIDISMAFFIVVLSIITLGWCLSISKGFIGGMILILAYFMFKKSWNDFILVILLLLTASFLTVKISSYAKGCYSSYIRPNSLISFYNSYFGPRFGYVMDKKGEMVKIETTIFKKSDIDSSMLVDTKMVNKSDFINIDNIADGKYYLEKGYLDNSLNAIKNRLILGFGYVTNISSGDSMYLNLLIRGGVIGTVYFFIFILVIIKSVKDKLFFFNESNRELSKAWIFSAVLFSVMGLLLPTFIQDRTGDVFWIIGSILLFSNEKITKQS